MLEFSLLPTINEDEWTLAVGCQERHDDTDEVLNCIKILQILKSNFQLRASKPIENHEIILTSMPEEAKDDDSWESASSENDKKGEKKKKRSGWVLNGAPSPGASDDEESFQT